jgi:hypothetical protein
MPRGEIVRGRCRGGGGKALPDRETQHDAQYSRPGISMSWLGESEVFLGEVMHGQLTQRERRQRGLGRACGTARRAVPLTGGFCMTERACGRADGYAQAASNDGAGSDRNARCSDQSPWAAPPRMLPSVQAAAGLFPRSRRAVPILPCRSALPLFLPQVSAPVAIALPHSKVLRNSARRRRSLLSLNEILAGSEFLRARKQHDCRIACRNGIQELSTRAH